MSSKSEKIAQFNPSGVGALNGNLFGLPFDAEECEVIVIPVPWDVTVSFADGTSSAPAKILEASPQLDLFDAFLPDAWTYGIHLLPIPTEWQEKSNALREKAKAYIEALENGEQTDNSIPEEINQASEALNQWVQETAQTYLNQGKKVALLGGDHSTPYGLIKALESRYESFGILQIDAHCDLRNAYEGFTYSHASIMYNAFQSEQIEILTQVGIRDYCDEELEYIQDNDRIWAFTDKNLQQASFEGRTWKEQCEKIIRTLPDHVYISFDIDGLDPKLCPNTGTPVPGGLEYEQAIYLLEQVSKERTIIGFDLVEVGNDDWDANVGARLLYRMSNLMIKSSQKEE